MLCWKSRYWVLNVIFLTCSRHDIAENCWVGVKQQSPITQYTRRYTSRIHEAVYTKFRSSVFWLQKNQIIWLSISKLRAYLMNGRFSRNKPYVLIKWKTKNYHTVCTIPKSSRKIVKRGKIETIIYIYMTTHFLCLVEAFQ